MKNICLKAAFVAVLFVVQTSYSIPSGSDSVNVLAVRVQFAKQDTSTTTGDGTFDLSDSENQFKIDPPPHNRSYFQDHLKFLENYYFKVSHGQLHVTGDVFPLGENAAYQLDEPMTNYNPNTTPDAINNGLARLLRDAIQKADQDPI